MAVALAQQSDSSTPDTQLAENPTIVKIDIEGLIYLAEDDILAKLESKEGQPLDADKVRRDTDRLFQMGWFTPDIRSEQSPVDGGVNLVFHVQENRRIEDVRIIGNLAYSMKRILDLFPQKTGDTLKDQTVGQFQRAVHKLYTDSGHTGVSITPRVLDGSTPDTVVIELMIDEGRKIKIRDTHFAGNSAFSSMRLRLHVDNSGSWGPFPNYLNQDNLERDRRALEDFYRGKGYLDALVQPPAVDFSEIKEFCDVTFVISEGPRYKVTAVRPAGHAIMSKEEIEKCFIDMQGRIYSDKRLQKALEKLAALYGDEGYMKMEPRVDYEKDPFNAIVALQVDIVENERMYTGQVKIEREDYEPVDSPRGLGRLYEKVAPPVKDEVIEREIRMRPNDVYRRYEEVRTVERLKRLGLFDDVQVLRQPAAEANTWNPVVSVKEKPSTGRFMFFVGAGEESGGYGGVAYQERNLFGDARDLRARVTIGQDYTSYRISYLDRYYKETEDSLQLEIFRNYNGYKAYDTSEYGFSWEKGHPLEEYLTRYVKYRLGWITYDVDNDVEEDPENYPIATAAVRWVHDTRDSVTFPRQGHRLMYGAETGIADGPLLKFTGYYSRYSELNRDWVHAMELEGGISPIPSEQFGHSERFFLGGSSDLRGFSYRGAGPKDDGDDDFPLGGSTKLLMRNELRHPFSDNLYGLFFFDIGTIGEDPVIVEKPRASIGTGLQFTSEVFRIRLELALPLVRESDDETRYFHFGFGLGF